MLAPWNKVYREARAAPAFWSKACREAQAGQAVWHDPRLAPLPDGAVAVGRILRQWPMA
jgi:hypothetical protein